MKLDSDEASTKMSESDDFDEYFQVVLKLSISLSYFSQLFISSGIKNSQMRLKLPALSLACDRSGISDRNTATIASAILQDVGIISVDTKISVVDRMKVRREKEKKGKGLQKLRN